MLEINYFEIKSFIKSNNRFILGIDGLSRSGKTTFVEKLKLEFGNRGIHYMVFHLDDHIVERKKRYNTGFEEWYEYYEIQWDVEWLRKHLFENLLKSQEITLPYYDEDTDSSQLKTVKLPSSGIIIIEGVFLQRKEWRDFYDKVIFLNCSRERRLLRETKETQQNKEKFERRYWKAEEYYIDKINPMECADLILNT